MAVLDQLGLAPDIPVMLIAPPDRVLAEAGTRKPRPSIASTLQVAEPTARIAWWVERRLLTPATLSRFAWMLSAPGSAGWLIVDPEEEGLAEEELRTALGGTALHPGPAVALEDGSFALPVSV